MGEALCGEGLWANADGRALAAFVEELREAARGTGFMLEPRELHAVLRDAMERVAVRPPWGGHPRVAIYGLLEARMSRANLVICGGLVEGIWPGNAAPDPLVPPAVLRALGVPGADFRIGLSAHDLAAALGAPEVVLSHAQRDDGAPVVPSRFLLRVKAMLGELLERHEEKEAVRLAGLLDQARPAQPYPRPKPMPSADQRKVDISVTGLDRLRGDPYQFYASSILRLRSIDALDAEPSAAWKGTAVHEILDRWHKAGKPPDGLQAIADDVLNTMSAHPLMRSLWRPRLMAGLDWIADEILRLREEGRSVLKTEIDGEMLVRGVRIHGRADRIDRLADGSLAVVDYKTGKPPSTKQVNDGYALQLGLVAMLAEGGGFPEVSGEARRFEYWSLAKDKNRRRQPAPFGFWETPILEGKKKQGMARLPPPEDSGISQRCAGSARFWAVTPSLRGSIPTCRFTAITTSSCGSTNGCPTSPTRTGTRDEPATPEACRQPDARGRAGGNGVAIGLGRHRQDARPRLARAEAAFAGRGRSLSGAVPHVHQGRRHRDGDTHQGHPGALGADGRHRAVP